MTIWARLLVLVAAAALQAAPPTDSTIRALADVITREYIDTDVAARVSARLGDGLVAGRYAGVQDDAALVALVNADLFAATHDKHLQAEVVLEPAAASPATPRPSRAETVRRTNAGVRKVEILPENIGYLDIAFFFRPEEARDALAAAMHLISHADALIVDMRANGGGSPETIALFVSYFLDRPGVALFDIAHRGEPTDHYVTAQVPAQDRNALRPVYVLTSARTFSGGEGVAYLLQQRRRAEIIGEVTAGAANPGRPYPVTDRISVTVPNGRVKSAIDGGNWEGSGVTPDVRVSAADALMVAQARARARLQR